MLFVSNKINFLIDPPRSSFLKVFCVSLFFQTEEDRPIFRPFTRESLAQIEARIQEENEKKRELEKKRAEGEVRPTIDNHNNDSSESVYYADRQITKQPAR